MTDWPIPDLTVDMTGAPVDPEERDRWKRRKQTIAWLEAWGFGLESSPTKRRIGEILAFRADRRYRLQLARIAKAQGRVNDIPALVRLARTKHRLVMRQLKAVRATAAARSGDTT